ncbi:hypothetical protein CIT25_33465 [Mesorhizobium mediterraneum]|uniref:Uncharacterized protein n=1 Tax=Mesorhizobium mediterraneum TaxID=43617 RepID=A0AB36R028_9HYPH|nr:hypothetical protein CIT25_33465 [Mesorhizobium mediterraneum]
MGEPPDDLPQKKMALVISRIDHSRDKDAQRPQAPRALRHRRARARLVEPDPPTFSVRAQRPLLQVSRPLFPFLKLVWADGGYERVTTATTITVEIIRKQSHQVAFVVLPMCWVVERFKAS